jgi:hypothetical protein
MSQLPRADDAELDDIKITRYLLDPFHSQEAAAKARFFASHGFSAANWTERKGALLDHPRRNSVSSRPASAFGHKYVVSCSLSTPDGRDPCIVTVWIIEPPSQHPRFVTAYPGP